MANFPALPAGFEVESVGKSSEVSALPEGFEIESIPEEESFTQKVSKASKNFLADLAKGYQQSAQAEGEVGRAIGETALWGGTGLVAFPASISAQVMTRAKEPFFDPGAAEKARKVKEATAELLTYQPKSSVAQSIVEAVSPAINLPTIGRNILERDKAAAEAYGEGIGNVNLKAGVQTTARLLQELGEPLRYSLEQLGLADSTAEDLAKTALELKGYHLAGKGFAGSRQAVKNLIREVKAEKSTAGVKPATQELPALETAKAEFQKPEVRSEYEAFLDDVEGKGRAGEEGMIEDLVRKEDVRTERKALEEYERFPELPEGFEIESIPEVKGVERPGPTSIEKPLSDLRPDARSATGDVVEPFKDRSKVITAWHVTEAKPFTEFKDGIAIPSSEGMYFWPTLEQARNMAGPNSRIVQVEVDLGRSTKVPDSKIGNFPRGTMSSKYDTAVGTGLFGDEVVVFNPKNVRITPRSEEISTGDVSKVDTKAVKEPTAVHGTTVDNLDAILSKGLRPGSALDFTPSKDWAGEFEAIVEVPTARKGGYVEHNKFYTSANTAKPTKVTIDLDNFTDRGAEIVKEQVAELKAKYPEVKFKLLNDLPVSPEALTKENIAKWYKKKYDLSEAEALESAKFEFELGFDSSDRKHITTISKFDKYMNEMEMLGYEAILDELGSTGEIKVYKGYPKTAGELAIEKAYKEGKIDSVEDVKRVFEEATSKKETPFNYQNKNQEQVYKEFKNGQYYRYNALEGAGDVFRELALRKEPDFGYISEKISHIEDQIKQERRGIHPDDSFETSRRENQAAFNKLSEMWNKQPVESDIQRVAVELNKDMLRGDFTAAEKNIKKIKDYFKKDKSERIDAGADAEARTNAALSSAKIVEQPQSAKGVFGKLGDKLKSEAGSVITAERKPFYSKLEEFVNKDMKLSLPIDSARKMAYNKGVTVDEWNDVFRHLRGNVTKGQLLDELAVHGRKFEDVILGERDSNKSLSELEQLELADLDRLNSNRNARELTDTEFQRLAELKDRNLKYEKGNKPLQFEQWSEPGYIPGSSRELFVTAPGEIPYSFTLHNKIAAELNRLDISPENSLYRQQKQEVLAKYGMTTEQWNKFKKLNWQDGHAAYSDIQNPIVRIRFNEREVNGKKVLFVEEIQGPSPENQVKMPESLRSRIYDIGVKRVVSYAKENGFDEIAWTNGKMQADRYNLTKVLDKVTWYDTPSRGGAETKRFVDAVAKDGHSTTSFYINKEGEITNANDSRLIGKTIDEAIGKELSKKVLTSSSGELQGLDLEIGGEGLKRLYDKTIPGLMEKYGGGKVRKIDLQLEPTVTRQQLKIPGAGPQETIVSSLPLTSKTPSTFTMYSDPFGFQAGAKTLGKTVESVKEGWDEIVSRNPTIAKLDEKTRSRIEEIYRGIKEGTLDPERVMREDPYALEVFKNLANAEESKNAFMQKIMPAFLDATKGIKKGSDSSMRIGKVLDGQAGVETLTIKEKKAFDFFKANYDWMIHEYARNAAGSEAAYKKVLSLVNNKQAKRSKIKDLSPEDRATYDQLRQAAREFKGDKKISELDPETREAYERVSQEARDFLHNDFTKNMPEGEKAAYDILSRKLTDYLPHLFDKKELKLMFEQDIAKLKDKLEKTTKKELVTKYKNQIASLEKALSGLEGGKWINFRDLPREVFFRFFEERKGAKGYSFDAVKAFESYVYGIARKIYDEPALRKSYEIYEKVKPELKPYTKELVDHYMGYGEKSRFDNFARFVTTYEWIRTLGLNPRSALVNLTQRLNTAVWVGEKYAIQAQKMMFLDKAKADALFDKSGVAREIPQVLMEGPVAPSLQGLRSVTGVLFDMVEKGNRQHAFLSGYLKAKAKGMAEDAAIKEGIKIVHKTQFRYGKLGMAKWTRRPGRKMALQFLSYPMKQAQFLYDLYKKDRLAFLRYAAYTIGGNLTLQELFDTDMSNAVGFGITFGEMLKAVQFAAEGDTRGAVRHFEQAFTPGGGLLPSGPGPAVSGAISVGKAISQGKGIEQLVKEITPVMWDRFKQAYKAIKNREGSEYPIYDKQDHMKYKLSARQLAQRTIGPRSEKEHRESLKFREERNLEQERTEITKEIAKKLAEGVLNDDEAAIDEAAEMIVKYGIELGDEQLENEIAARLTTKEERTAPGKKETYQLLREGEMLRDKYEEEE